jgi:translocation and assembly module TamB
MARPGRLRRITQLVLKIFGIGLVVLAGLVVVLLMSLDVAPVRAFIAGQANGALATSFRGKLVVRRIGHIDLRGVGGVDLEVHDPKGAIVLRARDASVSLAWPSLVYDAIKGADPLIVQLTAVKLEELRVLLIDDGTGTPTLAQAFEPRDPKPEQPDGAVTIVMAEAIAVKFAKIHGSLKNPGPVDLELKQLQARFRNDPAATQIVVKRVDLEAQRVPEVDRVSGRLSADVFLPAEPKDPGKTVAPSKAAPAAKPALRALATFSGDVAGSSLELKARLVGEALDGTVDVSSLSPATIAKLSNGGLSPQDPATLTARVAGSLDDLGFEANLAQQPSWVKVTGRFKTTDGRSAVDVRLEAAELDASRWQKAAPVTRITLAADANLQFDPAGGQGKYHLVLSPESEVPPHRLPETTVDGELSLPSGKAPRAEGTVEIAEPGAPTRIAYAVRAEPAGVQAQVNAKARLQRPTRLKALSGGLTTSGSLELSLQFDGAAHELNADLGLELHDIHHPAATAKGLVARATVHGDPAKPNLKFSGDLTRVMAAERAFERIRLSGSGTPERLELSAQVDGRRPDSVTLKTTLTPSAKELLKATSIDIEDRGTQIRIRADSVSVGGGRIALQRLTLDGPGHLEASLAYGHSLEMLELTARELEPVKLLRAFGIESALEKAKLDLHATFTGRGKAARATAKGAIREIKYGRLEGGTAEIDLGLERGKISGGVDVKLGPGATAKLELKELDAPLPPLTQQRLASLTGEVAMRGDIDLARIRPLFPFAGVERADGKVRFDVGFQRLPARKQSPSMRAQILTKQLILVGERPNAGDTQDAVQAKNAEPWTIRGIDFDLGARLDDRGAGVSAKLTDKQGELVTLNAEWKGITAERDLFQPMPALMNSPFTATTHIPARALEKLPAPIRPRSIRGTLALDIDAKGTLAKPEIKARGTIVRFGPATEKQDPRGLDLMLDAEYATGGGELSLRADGRMREVLVLESRWQGNLADFAKVKGGVSPVTGNLNLALNEFPVGVIPALQDRNIRGRLTGHAKLENFGRNAEFDLLLETRRLRIDRLMVDRIQAKARTTGNRIEFETAIEGSGGRAGARVTTGIDWGAKIVPAVDQNNVDGTAFANNLRLAAIQPLVEGSVSELDGRLNAEIRAKIAGGKPVLAGTVNLKDGVLQLPAIGQRFHGLVADVKLTQDSIRVSNLRGRGSSGRFQANASARLRGVTPVSIDAALEIKEDEKLPITLEGETIGDAWGRIEARYRHQEATKATEIQIDVKKLHVDLPEVSPQGIQDLSQDERIRVGFRRGDRRFATIALQPIEEPKPPSNEKTIVTVKLGEISVEKGQQAEVTLGGGIRAELGEPLDVRGQIETRRGTLDISGKQFEIERGSVSFTGGPPDNPTISAVARYDSPAGYTVYAEYTGTAKQGKLRLTADPPLSQDEILTLLMFGTPDGSLGAGSGDSLSTAVGVAGGTAAKGLNRALSDVTDLDVSARIDTSTGAPRPELVVQLSSRVAARVTQALGEPAPGQSPDRTFLTVEFRFSSAWSLSTMVGDKGASAVDVIWRRRY